MAWAWPSISLTGDTLRHYEATDHLARHQRDTTRFLEGILLGTEEGVTNFRELVGFDSRFEALTGPVRTSALMLGTIIREGVLTRASDSDPWVQRTGVDVLFQEVEATRGKKGMDKEGNSFEPGDTFTLQIFEKPDEFDVRLQSAPAHPHPSPS